MLRLFKNVFFRNGNVVAERTVVGKTQDPELVALHNRIAAPVQAWIDHNFHPYQHWVGILPDIVDYATAVGAKDYPVREMFRLLLYHPQIAVIQRRVMKPDQHLVFY